MVRFIFLSFLKRFFLLVLLKIVKLKIRNMWKVFVEFESLLIVGRFKALAHILWYELAKAILVPNL